MRRVSVRGVGLLASLTVAHVVLWASDSASSCAAMRRPSIIFFLVDDLGWADLSCYGSTYHETPHIDALAASGVRFTQAYAASPVCSPTRASILTGRHPVRLDITDWIPGMNASRIKSRRFQHIQDRNNLALDETTLAEYLKSEADYRTFFLGKWHLGDRGHWPTDQGFDVNIGGNDKGSPPGGYYAPWNNPTLMATHKNEYLTTRLTDEAVSIIEDAGDGADPFLMMFSYYNVHTPITPDRRTIDHFANKAQQQFEGPTPVREEGMGKTRMRQDNPAYASMVRAVDSSVGRVLDALTRTGQAESTIIVFFSDNGGLSTTRNVGPTCNLPLRAGKGWLYEGGIREPLLVRVPGLTAPGSTSDAIAVSTDFFPTLIDLVGLEARPDLHPDGISLKEHLAGAKATDRTLYWHYPHYHGSMWRPGAAIRDGRWKLIEFYEDERVELYDLQKDIGEQHDRSEIHPDVRDRLREKLKFWQQDSSATMPEPIQP